MVAHSLSNKFFSLKISLHPIGLRIHFLSLSASDTISVYKVFLSFPPSSSTSVNYFLLLCQKMETKWCVLFVTVAIMLVLAVNGDEESVKPLVKKVKGKKVCIKGWECKVWSVYCCNQTISDYFDSYQFENLFAKRNSPVAHAVGFWDYHSFITAAAEYQPLGFGTTGGKLSGMKEVAAFFGHVGSKTSCK